MKYIDLHTHSSFSDGTMTPATLVDHAKQAGLSAIALTDHDTMAGVPEAMARGLKQGVEVIPGIEISSSYNDMFMHILGYGLRHDDPILIKRLAKIQEARKHRNERIISKLCKLGIEVTMADLKTYSKEGQTGRPHIARLLLDRKVVRTQQEAFSRYLRKGERAYVDRFRYEAGVAINMIRDAGGLAILAHPVTIAPRLAGIRNLVKNLQNMGLEGIEVYYPAHSSGLTKILKQVAIENEMLITGGSDFHGDNKPDITLNLARERLNIPYSLLAEIKKRLGRRLKVEG
ncbi:MAG: PHP domain-containing protein [Thermodesulfobacteriota bacterium]|nr:PHP domain-containing protein [Thermodesulfobacteriota bacterium]